MRRKLQVHSRRRKIKTFSVFREECSTARQARDYDGDVDEEDGDDRTKQSNLRMMIKVSIIKVFIHLLFLGKMIASYKNKFVVICIVNSSFFSI